MTIVTTYGPGGYDPSKPNNNILSVEEVQVPDIAPDPVEPDTVIASVAAMSDEQKAALREALGI